MRWLVVLLQAQCVVERLRVDFPITDIFADRDQGSLSERVLITLALDDDFTYRLVSAVREANELQWMVSL